MQNDTKQNLINVVIYGYGNVASALVDAFSVVFEIHLTTTGRDSKKLKAFSEKHNVTIATSIDLYLADVVLLAVKDDVIEAVSKIVLPQTNGIVAHTSGTVGLDVFGESRNTACFYPLQTFNGITKPSFSTIPILISAKSDEIENKLISLGKTISNKVQTITPEAKKQLHLAAVIASNFTNTLLDEAEQILKKSNLPLDLLKPLLNQVVENTFRLSPYHAQTGPARRHDFGVIDQHLKMLKENPKMAEIYSLLSNLITEKYPK